MGGSWPWSWKHQNINKVNGTTFTTPSSTDKQETLSSLLGEKVKEDKLVALYRHLNVADDLDLINLHWSIYTRNNNKETIILVL